MANNRRAQTGSPACYNSGYIFIQFHDSSTATAIPSPPPRQIAASPFFPPVCSRAFNRLTRIRAPEAPMGWPSAHAPPKIFTCSRSSPNSRIKAMATTAKASFTSQMSTSDACQPSLSSSLRAAWTGAVVNQPGAWAKPA